MVGWAYSFVERHRSALVTLSPILLLFSLLMLFPPDGRERAQWIQFIGRFHPLAVHIPIALMLLVPVLEVAGRWEKFSYLRLSSRFVLGLATIAAAFAGFLGWCLARSGSYSGALVTQHMWGGVSLAAICWFSWVLRGRMGGPHAQRAYAATLAVGVLVVSWTGYRGGQVSQGEDHLTEYMPSLLRHTLGLADQGPLLEAAPGSFYEVRVQPVFAERCVACHGGKKQRSNLRLDSYGWLMRGGKHGAVIKSGNAQGSDLFRRITLSPDHDDFMPTGGKLRISLRKQEIDVRRARQLGLPQASFVLLSFADTGLGIDEETQIHLFEPFFTTKGRARVEGLGLATAFGFLRQSGGTITVQSKPREGSRFDLYLPTVALERSLAS